jgi:catechol 2,3-dioxygenase-like lactoylglutathione lyase family enzyme
MFELEGLDHVALGVRDVERSADWYVDVLGFERRYDGMWGGVPVFVARGQTAIALFPAKSDPANPSLPRKQDGMLHLALRANRTNFVAAQRELTNRGIAFHFQDHEISQSIYFRDPDGIELEITTYEVG